MKIRIIKVKDLYYVQRKSLFRWKFLADDYGLPAGFSSLAHAKSLKQSAEAPQTKEFKVIE